MPELLRVRFAAGAEFARWKQILMNDGDRPAAFIFIQDELTSGADGHRGLRGRWVAVLYDNRGEFSSLLALGIPPLVEEPLDILGFDDPKRWLGAGRWRH